MKKEIKKIKSMTPSKEQKIYNNMGLNDKEIQQADHCKYLQTIIESNQN